MKNADQTKAQTVLMYNNLISQSMIIGQTLVEDYVTLLKNPNVSRKVKEMLSHYSDSYTLDFEMSRKSCIIEVRARSQSAELAAQAVNATMSVFQEEQERLMGVRFMSPIQYASVPQNPYFPKLKILLGLGIFFGGFAGFALAILADLSDYFAMIMLADIDSLTIEFSEFVDKLEDLGKANDLVIHTMHEDIFNTMHHI